jgi:putative oxidoreductase
MTTSLWIAQLFLGTAFVLAGSLKLLWYARARALLPWVPTVPEALVRAIGAAELLGGLGLTLPSLTGVAPYLTPLAGAALAIVMSLAAAFHGRRGELRAIPVNVVLGALAIFVAYGRWALA